MIDGNHLRILAFEPYDTGSHKAVRRSISRHSRHEWTWVTLLGRSWKWRMRLAAAGMVEAANELGYFKTDYDVIFATSLMSTADLRALLPARHRSTPIVLYMHENQAAYPLNVIRWRDDETLSISNDEDAPPDVHFALTNLTSILAADLVIWNSEWNKRSFLTEIQRILKRAPDASIANADERIQKKSTVIWPPVEIPTGIDHERVLHNSVRGSRAADIQQGGARPIRVVWPHRWEHDKGPDELLRIARECTNSMNIRWTILGEQFPETPQPFQEFQKLFRDRIDHIGFEPDRSAYWDHLHRCDWVLSTAKHEFFGIAVVESLLAGCLPWLPNELSYTELVPKVAQELTPLNPPSPAEAQQIRKAIWNHLQPSVGENAVNRLDEALFCMRNECGDVLAHSEFETEI